jgi:hypothetical protein
MGTPQVRIFHTVPIPANTIPIMVMGTYLQYIDYKKYYYYYTTACKIIGGEGDNMRWLLLILNK